LRKDWGPEQNPARLKKVQRICISYEWIYQNILKDKENGGDLYQHLRCQKKWRQRYRLYY